MSEKKDCQSCGHTLLAVSTVILARLSFTYPAMFSEGLTFCEVEEREEGEGGGEREEGRGRNGEGDKEREGERASKKIKRGKRKDGGRDREKIILLVCHPYKP